MNLKVYNWSYLFIILILNVLAGLSVYYISNTYWWFYWIAPFLPYFLLVLVATLMVFLLKKKWTICYINFISIIFVGFLLWPFLLPVFNSKSSKLDKGSIAVLNYNVSFFYWRNDNKESYKDPLQNPLSVGMIQWLTQQDVDVIALQEFYSDKNSGIFNVVDQMQNAGYKYHNFTRIDRPRKRGLMTFSKHPIINSSTIFLSENNFNGAQCTDLDINGELIRVINLHLSSSQLGYFPSSLKSASFRRKLQWKLNNLKNSTIKRIEEFNKVLEFAIHSNQPYIILGDFNTPIYSGLMKPLNYNLKNSNSHGGNTLGFTYYINKYMALGIDHQYFNKELAIEKYIILDEINFNSHRPGIGFYQFNNSEH